MNALHDQIYELLKKGPMTDEALQGALNAPRPSLRRARQKLVNDGLIVKVSGGKIGALWGLPSAKTEQAPENDRPTVKQVAKPAKGTEGRPAPTPPPPARPGGFTF